jgi:hypothetical protein
MQQCVFTTTAAQSDREMLQKVWASAGGEHVDKCWVTHGTHAHARARARTHTHRVKDCDIIPQTEQLYCNFYCSTVHFNNIKVFLTNKCTIY